MPILTERGFGKRTPALSQYRPQGRGGQGVIAMKTDGERGKLAGVRVVRPGLHVIVSNFRDDHPHRCRLGLATGPRG